MLSMSQPRGIHTQSVNQLPKNSDSMESGFSITQNELGDGGNN